MKKTSNFVIVLLAVVIILVVFFGSLISSYNKLVTMDENVQSYASTIDTQLQRRSDLIPNLVATVEEYADHEDEVFTAIADARSQLAGASTIEEQADASDALDSAVSRLLAIAESYPELQSNENFINLQDELAGTENRIATARRDYNQAAQSFNTSLRKFPTVLIAELMGFESYDYFEADDDATDNPDVGDLFESEE